MLFSDLSATVSAREIGASGTVSMIA
jgi:hypothetical protein